MNRFLKSISVLFLSVCLFYQGLAVYVAVPKQSSTAEQVHSIIKSTIVTSVGLDTGTFDTCCDFHPKPDPQAEEKSPTMWEIDSHGPSSHPPYLPFGAVQIASSENSNYPTPIYTLHRPPDVLS